MVQTKFKMNASKLLVSLSNLVYSRSICFACVSKHLQKFTPDDLKAIVKTKIDNKALFGKLVKPTKEKTKKKDEKDVLDLEIKESKSVEQKDLASTKKRSGKADKDLGSTSKNTDEKNPKLQKVSSKSQIKKIVEKDLDFLTEDQTVEDKMVRSVNKGLSSTSNTDGDIILTPAVDNGNRWQHREELSEFSYILTYPMLKCEEVIDTSSLKQAAGKFVPSVTHIINQTMSDLSKFYLDRWKKNKIAELGEEGFKKYQEETFRNGSNLHANIQHYLSGTPESELDIYKGNEGHWDSIRKVLQEVKDAVAMEEPVTHQDLCYKGQFDCVARIKNKVCVIDWKTSQKVKPTLRDTFENPIQVAAYIGAINNSNVLSETGMDQITSGAIVIAYPDGHPAHVHIMDRKLCETHWKLWLERLQMYWKQVKSVNY